jgi:peptidyl-tRNA hydrolase
MQPLKIFMRNDLNMRTGKMAAQSGHAAMILVVNRFHEQGDQLRMSAEDVQDLRNFVQDSETETVLVAGHNDLEEGITAVGVHCRVIDNGATEFKGQKTLTCGGTGIFRTPVEHQPVSVADSGAPSTARQYFLFSREGDINKKTTCAMAAIGTVLEIEKRLVEAGDGTGDCLLPREGNEQFFEWILNGYPKIGLQAPTDDDLVALHARLEGAGLSSTLVIYDGHWMLCVGPEYAADLSPFTSQFKLL